MYVCNKNARCLSRNVHALSVLLLLRVVSHDKKEYNFTSTCNPQEGLPSSDEALSYSQDALGNAVGHLLHKLYTIDIVLTKIVIEQYVQN